MISRFLSLTLAAVVVGCPFLCGLPPAVGGDETLHSACCHCSRHSEPSRHDGGDSAPAHDDQSGRGTCQCICGGAVVEHSELQLAPVDLSGFEAAPVTVSLVACTSKAQLSSLHTLLQPDDGMNPGRATRCLFMSYLC